MLGTFPSINPRLHHRANVKVRRFSTFTEYWSISSTIFLVTLERGIPERRDKESRPSNRTRSYSSQSRYHLPASAASSQASNQAVRGLRTPVQDQEWYREDQGALRYSLLLQNCRSLRDHRNNLKRCFFNGFLNLFWTLIRLRKSRLDYSRKSTGRISITHLIALSMLFAMTAF